MHGEVIGKHLYIYIYVSWKNNENINKKKPNLVRGRNSTPLEKKYVFMIPNGLLSYKLFPNVFEKGLHYLKKIFYLEKKTKKEHGYGMSEYHSSENAHSVFFIFYFLFYFFFEYCFWTGSA